MKQITLDFETYEKEIKDARVRGFEIRHLMLAELKACHSSLQSRNQDTFLRATSQLYTLIRELEANIEVGE